MKKENWAEIYDDAPNALKACKSYFEHRFMAQWPEMITRHRYLFQYFQKEGIQISITNKPIWNYSITVAGEERRKVVYGSMDNAEQEAIMEAFRNLEATKFKTFNPVQRQEENMEIAMEEE